MDSESTGGGVAGHAAPQAVPSPSAEDVDHKPRPPGRPPSHVGCQVCGCSLEDAKSFHQRYHICDYHMMSPSVERKGTLQRFCQQCGRFHDLDRFDPVMRSCRQQLQRHAERRRRARAAAAAAASTGAASQAVTAQAGISIIGPADSGASAGHASGYAPRPTTKRQRSVLDPPAAGQPAPKAVLRSPDRELPQGTAGGSRGSSMSDHSAHQHGAGLEAMDVLAAVAVEEEEAQHQQQGVRLEPDLSWFTPPQPDATAAAAAGNSDAAGTTVPSTSGPAALGEVQASVSLSATQLAPQPLRGLAYPPPPLPGRRYLGSQPALEQADLQMLLYHLVAASQPAPLAAPTSPLAAMASVQLAQQQAAMASAPTSPLAAMASLQLAQQQAAMASAPTSPLAALASLQLAQQQAQFAQQQAEAAQEVQLRRLLWEQQQAAAAQEAQVGVLFAAAAERILAGIMGPALHHPPF